MPDPEHELIKEWVRENRFFKKSSLPAGEDPGWFSLHSTLLSFKTDHPQLEQVLVHLEQKFPDSKFRLPHNWGRMETKSELVILTYYSSFVHDILRELEAVKCGGVKSAERMHISLGTKSDILHKELNLGSLIHVLQQCDWVIALVKAGTPTVQIVKTIRI